MTQTEEQFMKAPRKTPERAREILHLRVRRSEKAAWRRQARAAGLTLSAWIQQRLNAPHP